MSLHVTYYTSIYAMYVSLSVLRTVSESELLTFVGCIGGKFDVALEAMLLLSLIMLKIGGCSFVLDGGVADSMLVVIKLV